MDAEVLTDPRVQSAVAQFVPVKVSFPEGKDAFMKYRVIGTPVIYVVDPEGAVVGHISGPLDPALLVTLLDEIRRLAKPAPAIAKPTVDGALRLAYRFKTEEAKAMFPALQKDRSVASRDLAHVAFTIGQAAMFGMKYADAATWFEKGLDFAIEPMQRSALMSGLASVLMSSKGDRAKALFEAIAREPKFPAIDRWCAEYQLGVLGGKG